MCVLLRLPAAALLWLLMLAPASAVRAEAAEGALLILLSDQSDAPSLTDRRRARHTAFLARAARSEAAIRQALPAAVRKPARFEALPALNAWLLHAPERSLAEAYAAINAASARLGIAHVARHGLNVSPPDALPTAGTAPLEAAADLSPRRTLGIIDLGADLSHPLLQRALGRVHVQPGTPGAGADGRLIRSHGTAMAGVYAQLLQGQPLRAGGVDLPWLRLPRAIALTDTLVAHAGPETRAGRSDLARALNWMLTPTPERPLPDVINYSQGNGRLCASGTPDCDPATWAGVTRVIDRLIDELGVTVVKSAGNRGDRDDNTMTVPGETFNGITVGNMHAFDWQACAASAERRAHKIYRTSSVAPAAPAPRLLDVVAPGVRIDTTGVNPAYCRTVCDRRSDLPCSFCPRLGRFEAARHSYWKVNSGTSPAAAVVGALALSVIDEGLRDPRAVKALLINSADTWTSADTPHPRVRGNGGGCEADVTAARHAPYPYGAHYDRRYGWGYVNPARLARERAHTVVDSADGPRCYAATLEAWDKITLVWHRHVRSCAGCEMDASSALNRLHLDLVSAQDARTIDSDRGQSPLDNVLQVSNGRGPAAAPRARAVIVRVDAAAAESYALASPRALTRLPSCPTP
jgi:hypothetical protein